MSEKKTFHLDSHKVQIGYGLNAQDVLDIKGLLTAFEEVTLDHKADSKICLRTAQLLDKLDVALSQAGDAYVRENNLDE